MKIKKCLFPAAGYGTRFLPATKATPKEMLPVLTKPLIQYGVEEALEAGLDTMAIVTGRGKRAIEDHFDISYELEHQIKGTSKEHYLSEIRSVITNCTFSYTRQVEMKGLGHAILCGETLIGDEPFAVVLADDLCDNDGDGVLSQMINIYNEHKCCVVAIEEVPQEDTNKYGVIAGQLIGEAKATHPESGEAKATHPESGEAKATHPESGEAKATHPESGEAEATCLEGDHGCAASAAPNNSLYQVTDMVEKPDPKDAPSNLAIIGRYILTPDIFDILKETKPGKGGEIQITDALLELAKQGKVIAYKFKGKRFDCGSVNGFVEATNYFYEKTN